MTSSKRPHGKMALFVWGLVCIHKDRSQSTPRGSQQLPLSFLAQGRDSKAPKRFLWRMRRLHHNGQVCSPAPQRCACRKRDGLRAKTQLNEALPGLEWSHELPHAFWDWRGPKEMECQDRGSVQPFCGAVLWALALGLLVSAVHRSQSQEFTLQLHSSSVRQRRTALARVAEPLPSVTRTPPQLEHKPCFPSLSLLRVTQGWATVQWWTQT